MLKSGEDVAKEIVKIYRDFVATPSHCLIEGGCKYERGGALQKIER